MNTIPTGDDVQADGTVPAGGHPPTSQPATPARGLGHPTAAWVIATFGAVAGLIPLLFFIAIPAGIVGLALGIGAWRKGRRHGVPQGKAGTIVGALALALGMIGMTIFFSAFDQLEEDLNEIGEEMGSPSP